MKQGTVINRIVMLVLFGAVVLYVGVSAYNSLRSPFSTVLSYSYTVYDSLEATGFLVREETVLTGSGGIVDLLPEEGEKVACGETVAMLYGDASGLEQKQQLQSLSLELEQLEYALERSDGSGDASQLSQQVIASIVTLRAAVSSGDLTNLEDETLELKSLVYKRDYTYDNDSVSAAEAIQASIDAVSAQISALTAQTAQNTSQVIAQQSGIFSGEVDGYETLLTPDMLSTITPSQLSQLSSQQLTADDSAIGKLITDFTWYFVFPMDAAEAKRLQTAGKLVANGTVTVRFSRDWSGEVDMTVEQVGQADENGQLVVVLSSSRYLSQITLLRQQTVELIFDSQTGIRIPKEALRVVEQTTTDSETGEATQISVTGVYAVVGEQVEFKPVTVLAESDSFILVEPVVGTTTSQAKKALRAGDQVIVAASDLYDGMVLR